MTGASKSDEQFKEIVRLCQLRSPLPQYPEYTATMSSSSSYISKNDKSSIVLKRCTNCNSDIGFQTLTREQVLSTTVEISEESDDHHSTGDNGDGDNVTAADTSVDGGVNIPHDKLVSIRFFFKCKNQMCGKLFWEGPKYDMSDTKIWKY